MNDDKKMLLGIVAIAVAVLSLFGFLWWAARPPTPQAERPADASRLTYERQGDYGSGLYIITDRQTGKQYLAANGCGLIEIEPTKEAP